MLVEPFRGSRIAGRDERSDFTRILGTQATGEATMWVRSLFCLIGVLTVAGCGTGHSNSAVSADRTGPSTRTGVPASGSVSGSGRLLSVVRMVGPGQTIVVVRIKRFGRLRFHCGHAGTSSASFTVPRSGATTMIVVGQAGHATLGANVDPGHSLRSAASGSSSLQQEWQITPWSSAGSSVMTVTLSALEGSPPGSPGCGVAARVTIGPA
jgi:hypothetical protein